MNVTVIHKSESVIYNGVIYGKGQSFEIDDSIGESLMNRGYVAITAPAEDVEEIKVEAEKAEAEKIEGTETLTGYLDEADLRDMAYSDLKRLASQMGISANGKKEELIKRICATQVEADAEGEAEEETSDDLPNTAMPE